MPEMVDTGEPERQKERETLCRVCGIPMLTKVEARIGVHISCVQTSKFSNVTIPRPRYGTARE